MSDPSTWPDPDAARANALRAPSGAALVADLRATIEELTLVVEDFLPNIGRCALQNYARLNTAMIAGAKNRAVLAAAKDKA